MKPRILVGMSGGVDSSLSAALLLEAGYEVVGGFIKNWSDSKDLWTGECEWRGERRDALRVAAKLGISLLTFDFEASYRERVLGRMFAEYERGLTPNPDVLCNEEIKFGLFFEAAMKAGFDGVATGHYARIHRDADGTAHLLKGIDPEKDQSYFLYRLPQSVLQRVYFPVGHLLKTQVRDEAAKRDIPTATKPDSQGICFVGKLNFHEFLRKKIPPVPGDIVTEEGRIIGRHDGLDAYTIGQRQGLHLSTDGKTWYVAAKEKDQNRLIVVDRHDHPLLYHADALLGDLHWTRDVKNEAKQSHWTVQATIRYRQKPQEAQAFFNADHTVVRLAFREPVWGLAPGQSAVLYQDEECLGGGVLLESLSQ